jgi:acetyl esterase
MPLHPQAQAFLDLLATLPVPPRGEFTVEMARQGLPGVDKPPGPAVGAVRDFTIADADGAPMRMRAYTPADAAPGPLPVLLFIHGGGWVMGDLEMFDAVCRELSVGAGCGVVAVEYRRAPEAKFPAAPRDCYAALEWVAEHAGELGIDPARIAVGGDSAGGNLAAAVTLMARDRGGPAIVHQMLVYPVTHHAFDTASYRDLAEGHLLTLAGMRWNWNHYLPDAAAGRDPLASPLLAPSLAGLPPAFLITAEYDPLRDEGEAYAQRLAEAGVPVEFKRYDGMIHAFFTLGQLFDDGRTAVAHAAQALRRAFAAG